MSEYTPLAYTEPLNVDSDAPLRLAVLGATGSIGRQTLDLVKTHSDRFSVTALSVNSNIDAALLFCREFQPRILVVCDEDKGREAQSRIRDYSDSTEVLIGAGAMCEIVTRHDVDLVVTATVGYSGFIPTVAAVRAGKDIALANKETLVVGGEIIRELMASSKSRIFPVDSEHSAIAQCLRGEDRNTVDKLIITASGGPFRNMSVDEMAQVTCKDALKHPNWNMGAKITIDSATMMNKAFEIIEAHYLFGVDANSIEAVVHPQSIVHSMVQFTDGSLKAQMGMPDMHLPIAYALGLNNRLTGAERPLSLKELRMLTFEAPDYSRFPCLDFAGIVLRRKGNSACIVNAANEIAVDAFLRSRIKFTDIPRLITLTLEAMDYEEHPDIERLMADNRVARRIAEEFVKSFNFEK